MPRFSYYPGCSLHSTATEYDASTRAVLAALGIEVEELADWNCCGASSGHALSPYLAHALPLRNLILAEQQGEAVVVPCAACYNLLRVTQDFMARNPEAAERINRDLKATVGHPYEGRAVVRHLLDVLSTPEMLRLIRSRVRRPLTGLRIAAYYGCLLNRPAVVSFEESPEQPTRMEKVLEAVGATPVSWTGRTDCCGASLSLSRPDLVSHLVGTIVAAAYRAGAAALVTACPLCQSNLDGRQSRVDAHMPVFYVSEVVGIALGLQGAEGWLGRHLLDPRPLLQSLPRSISA
ncbi:MAG: CoB--CoM heterodisulfide reductase iron-sulfur subunit B family protein [Moorellales bacterium]